MASARARPQLRQLARDMIRNRAIAARARDVVVGSVVGAGIVPSVTAPDLTQAQRDAIGAVVGEHLLTVKIDAMREHSLCELQAIAMAAIFSDGEVLVRRRWRDPAYEPDLALPFQIELLEIDHLDHSRSGWGQNQVQEGIEYGPTGRVEAYHLLQFHPGDGLGLLRQGTVRVPARDVLHLRRVDRPEQVRGVPWLAPVMLTLGELSDYQEAQILKQKVAALLAVILESEGDGVTPPDMSQLATLGPGAVVQAPPGWKPNFTTPPRVDGYPEFMKEGLRRIATGIGITYESLAGDLEGVNFSSGRMGRIDMDRNIDIWQALLVRQFCQGVERWMQDAWRKAPSLPRGAFRLEWTAPRRPLIDPTKEIPAMLAEIEGGLTSLQRQQRRLGYDPETIRREREEDRRLNADAAPSSAGVAVALARGAHLREIEQ